jgi:flavodoxin
MAGARIISGQVIIILSRMNMKMHVVMVFGLGGFRLNFKYCSMRSKFNLNP